MQNTVNKGITAESYVANYLEKIGYLIIARNFHSRYGEIDIICKDGEQVVFVEVKSLRIENAYCLEQLMTRHKLFKIRQTISEWCKKQPNIYCLSMRIDFVGIVINHAKCSVSRIKHLKNIGIF